MNSGKSLDCANNPFCHSLKPETRARLCEACLKRTLKAESYESHTLTDENALLLTKGAAFFEMDNRYKVKDSLSERISSYLATPGRVLQLHLTFSELLDPEYERSLEYSSMLCLTDCEVAQFRHSFLSELFDSDKHFARALMQSSIRVMQDACELYGILRTNYAYTSTCQIVRMLMSRGIFLGQKQVAFLTNHDRATITRAFAKMKKVDPALYQSYMTSKK